MPTRIDIVDTIKQISGMSNGTPRASEGVIESDTKGSINLRIEARTRRLIDDAAAVLGKSRTEL